MKEARFLGLNDADADAERAKCVVLPIPYERTSSYAWGSKSGPEAILTASQQVEFFDSVLECEPYKLCGGVYTDHPMAFYEDEESAESMKRIQKSVKHWIDRDKFVVMIGGEHMTSLGCILAHGERYKGLTVVQFDAHSDLRDSYEGTPYNHACIMRRVFEHGIQFVQVGIRSQAVEEFEFQKDHEIPVFTSRYVHDSSSVSRHSWIRDVIALTGENVYVTFDCDALDPSIMPATGTPEPDGLTWSQVTHFFEILVQWRNLVGIDITELAPIDGVHHPQFTIAKLINRVIGLKYSERSGAKHSDEVDI